MELTNGNANIDTNTAGASVAGGIVSGILGTIMNIWSNIQNQRNYKKMLEYNSPEKQVERLQAAGLNPNLAMGMSNTVSSQAPLVSNPAESLMETPNNIMKMYNTADMIKNRKITNSIRLQNLGLEQMKADLKKKIATQALKRGDIDLAMKTLSYDILAQTAPATVEKAFADAGLASNKKGMSDIDLATYDDYRSNIIDSQIKRNKKLDIETDYLQNVKPKIEWFKAKTARMGVKYSHSDRVAALNKQIEIANMNQKQRDKEYTLAVRKFNLAVRQQNWSEAHYWADIAASAVGAGVKTVGRMYGIPIQ